MHFDRLRREHIHRSRREPLDRFRREHLDRFQRERAGFARWLALGLTLIAAGGCSASDAPEADGITHEVDTELGFERTRISGEAPLWSLDTVYTVGAIGGGGDSEPEQFGYISSVVIDEELRLWVAEGQAREVRAFDASGDFVAVAGREGEGPGEFSGLGSLSWLGDRLLTLDAGNARIQAFSPEGTFLDSRPTAGGLTGSPAFIRFYNVGDSIAVLFSADRRPEGIQSTWVEHDREGEIVAFDQVETPPGDGQTIVCEHSGGAISFFSSPFASRTFQLPVGGRRVWIGEPGAYRLTLLEAGGDTLRMIERTRAPEPISDAEWEAGTEDFRTFRDERPDASCDARGFERKMFKGAFNNLLTDTTGRLWAEVWDGEAMTWEIFSPDGRLIGRLPGFGYSDRVAPAIRGDALAWVDTDELDVPRVVVARIVRP